MTQTYHQSLFKPVSINVMSQLFLSVKKDSMEVISMRHGIRTNRLGRPADQRKAIIRSLVTQVLTYGKIRTTMVRAKYIRKYVDKMITLSKNGGIQSRRQMEAFIYNKKLVSSIMADAPEHYAERQ